MHVTFKELLRKPSYGIFKEFRMEAFFLLGMETDRNTLKFQKEGTSVTKDLYTDFGFKTTSVPLFVPMETKEPSKRDWADEDGEEYRRLAADTVRNRWWGYDYRVDFEGGGLPSAEWFLAAAREDFHRKNEMPVGIYCGGELIGEAVLHRFGYASEAEVGARLLPESEGRGYASEAVRAMTEYAFLKLGLDRVEAKCNRENERSAKMLVSAGMRRCGEDDTYYYFYKTPAT